MSARIGGVVLAGGRSRRMGGSDKALIPLAGRALVQRIAARLAPQVEALIVNANGDPARFAALGFPVVADEHADFPGPLAGVLAGLHWFAQARPQTWAVASVAADAPFVPDDLVVRLEAALVAHPDARVAVAQSRGRRHHVTGLWRMEAATEIAAALARGERKVETMVDRLGAVAVPFSDLQFGGEAVDPFFNINTPEDLAHAEALLAGSSSPPHKAERNAPFVVGVAGWKNSGKTTLVERLVATLVRRGYRVSTIKHSHHDVSFEAEGTDSARHLRAGAQEVALVSPRRWAVLRDGQNIAWRDEAEPTLAVVIAQLAPADVVIVEGLKKAQISKIEVRRTAQGDGPPLAADDPLVFAVAADHDVTPVGVPSFALDDADGLTDALLVAGGLTPRRKSG